MTKKIRKSTASRDRVVYEVKGQKGTRQIDASTTAELKTALSDLLPLDPYSTQAAAHLAHIDRAQVQGQGWSVRRLGVLAFVPDNQPTSRDQAQLAERIPEAEHRAAMTSNPPVDNLPVDVVQMPGVARVYDQANDHQDDHQNA